MPFLAMSLAMQDAGPACFFLVPGRPIRWALKIALGPTGNPSRGQLLLGSRVGPLLQMAGRGHQKEDFTGGEAASLSCCSTG